MIGVICAMKQEQQEIVSLLKDVYTETDLTQEFIRGKLGDQEVVTALCGVGKGNAAITTTLMIRRYAPELVINTGCAGSLDADVHVGDTVISERIADWDIDIPDSPNYFRSFETENLSFKADEKALKILKKSRRKDLHFGGIVSGEAFIYKKSQVNTIKRFYPTALCGEMEGTSVARACRRLSTGFLVIRSISDATLVRGDYKNFDFNLETACRNAAKITAKLIERYEQL